MNDALGECVEVEGLYNGEQRVQMKTLELDELANDLRVVPERFRGLHGRDQSHMFSKARLLRRHFGTGCRSLLCFISYGFYLS